MRWICCLLVLSMLCLTVALCASHAPAATTERVGMSSDGKQADRGCLLYPGGISADGRFVAFLSSATNLVPNDTNGSSDVFVRDRLTGLTARVSVASDGAEAAGASQMPSMSADGRYVVFSSDAANLVPDDNNGCNDVFLHDRLTEGTSRVSISSDGTEANGATEAWGSMPSISADGRYVAFCSEASNLVPDDTNDTQDVFVHDRLTGETELLPIRFTHQHTTSCR